MNKELKADTNLSHYRIIEKIGGCSVEKGNGQFLKRGECIKI